MRELKRLKSLCLRTRKCADPSQQKLVQEFHNELPNHIFGNTLTIPAFRSSFNALTQSWKRDNRPIHILVYKTLATTMRKVEIDYKGDPKRIEELLYDEAFKLFIILQWWHNMPSDVRKRLKKTFRLFVKLTTAHIRSLPAPPDSPTLMLEHVFVPIKTEC